MNDQQETAPEQSDERPAADAQKTEPRADEALAKAPTGLGESTPVRAISSAAAFAATCLVVGAIAGAAIKLIPALARNISQSAAGIGVQTLARCWLAGLVAVVMTNSFLLGNRGVVVRRSGVLGAVSGLLAVVLPPICLAVLKGGQIAPRILSAMRYIVAAAVLLICLSWRSGEKRSAGDGAEEASAKGADEEADKAGAEGVERDGSEE